MEKSADAFRTISEVAEDLKLPQHVLRFWETRFPQVRPMKRGGNRRFYRPDDVELLRAIKTMLYGDGFTIKGVQRILKERGPRAVASLSRSSERGALQSPRPIEPLADDFDDGEARGDVSGGDAAARTVPLASEVDEPVLGGFALPSDVLDGLEAILFELSECRRILASAHE